MSNQPDPLLTLAQADPDPARFIARDGDLLDITLLCDDDIDAASVIAPPSDRDSAAESA